jgi:SAM-dependent methyltransferase
VTRVHRAAEVGFSRSAEAYERGRPGYPEAAISHLVAQLPARPLVLDLAAGTGKLTRPLLESGMNVIAVEPVAEMRAVLPLGARVLEGTAEAIPLAASSVDAVTVGTAFHWFDGEGALTEIARVLRLGGVLALLWNRRAEDDPLNAAIEGLLAPHRAGVPTHRGDAWRAAFDSHPQLGPLEERTFENLQHLDAGGMEARIGSISFIAALDAPERDAVLARARALAGEDGVTVPYRTEVQISRRASAP